MMQPQKQEIKALIQQLKAAETHGLLTFSGLLEEKENSTTILLTLPDTVRGITLREFFDYIRLNFENVIECRSKFGYQLSTRVIKVEIDVARASIIPTEIPRSIPFI